MPDIRGPLRTDLIAPWSGQASGDVATRLLAANMDVGVLRPFSYGERNYISVRNGYTKKGKPKYRTIVQNAPATLRYDDWKIIDDAIQEAAKPQLQAVADLIGAGLTFNIPNVLGKTVIQYDSMGDITEATISMDPIRTGESDRPEFQSQLLPLPVCHKDFQFTLREIMISRNGTPLDTTTARLASRRVSELIEQLLIGVASSYTFGGGTLYGYKNFPSRNTYTINTPTDAGWTPGDTVRDVLAMIQISRDDLMRGPWVLYVSSDWDQYLDDDYSDAKGDNTLRERIEKIRGIMGVRTLDYLTGDFDMLLVQMDPLTVRMGIGMGVTSIEWDTHGGWMKNFKVMACMVPQLRADFNGRCGIVDGTVA
jgi:hypothetical protein